MEGGGQRLQNEYSVHSIVGVTPTGDEHVATLEAKLQNVVDEVPVIPREESFCLKNSINFD